LLLICLISFSARGAVVQAADDKTVEAARKEGRVSFYTTMGADEAKMLADSFQSKYPSIGVEITRLGSENCNASLPKAAPEVIFSTP